MKMLWDDNYLYIYAELEEEHIWNDLTERDAIIYYNNDFEIFIDPSNDTRNYGEIEINAIGTIFDLLLNKPYKVGGQAIINWDIKELKSAVKVYGTLNNPADKDSKWTIEMAIPLQPFVELKRPPKAFPKESEVWRINFSRVNWDYDINDEKYSRKKVDGKFLPEYNWVWSPQYVINMHEPEKWGYLQSSDQEYSATIQVIEDVYMHDKQIAYALFRMTMAGELKYLLENEIGTELNIKAFLDHSKSINTKFFKTQKGFEYSFNSQFSNKLFIIDEEGLLKIKAQ